MNLFIATDIVSPATVDSAPYVLTAFISGMLAPVSLWGIAFLATVVKKGIKTGGGGIGGES